MEVYVATDHYDEQAVFDSLEKAVAWLTEVSYEGVEDWVESDGLDHWSDQDGFVSIEKYEVR